MIRRSNVIIYVLMGVLVMLVLGMAGLGITATFYNSTSETNIVQIVVAGDQRLTLDVKYNKTLDISSMEEIEGYTFEGLYRDSIFTYKFDMNSPITKDLTLYAKYSPKLYTLTFYANDGTDDFQVLKRYYDTLTDLSELDFSDSPNNYGFKVAGFSEDPNASFATIYLQDMLLVRRDAAYYAVWRGTAQSVTFDTTGARTLYQEDFKIEPTTVYLNSYYTVPNFSEVYNAANGATFKGFTKSGDTTIYTPGSKILITAATTLKMVFNSATNAVVLNYLDAENQKSVYYGIGNVVSLPENLTKTNYELVGWSRYKREFREYAENEIIKLPGNVQVTSGTTQYYAVWAGQIKNIVYVTNYAYKEGGVFRLNPTSVRYGEKLTIPSLSGVYSILTEDNPDLNYPGKSSIGKYAGFKLLGNDRVYAPGSEIVIANEIILVMVFDGNEDSITLNFNDDLSHTTVGLNTMLVLPTASRDGYDFAGWAESQKDFEDYADGEIFEAGTTVVVTSGKKTYFAIWKKALLTVSHNTTGAINSLGQSVVVGEATVKNLEYYTIPMIEDCFNIANGSKYKGFRDAEGQIYEPNDEILITENITLYIVFDGIENSTTFDYRNGQPNTKVYGIGLSYTLPVPNAITRYEFVGWSTILKDYDDYSENEIYVSGQIIHLSEGLTIYYAIWRPVAIELVFNANAADASGSVANKIVRYTEKTNLPINLYVRSKHNFAGWSLYPDGSGTIYNAGATFTLNDTYFSLAQNGTLDFYAVWTIKTLTVTFNYNGGTPAEGGFYQKTVEYNSVFTLPNAQKANRTFLGWSPDINATSGVFDAYEVGTVNITLHAIWKENIVLNINGGSGFQPFVEYNSTLTKFRLVNSYSNPGTSYLDVVTPAASRADYDFYYYSTVPGDNETKQEGDRYGLFEWYDLPDSAEKTVLYAIYIAPTATFEGWNLYNGKTAEYIVVPKGITTTGASKFENNVNLKFITLPQGFTHINTSAFSGATSLTGVSISNDLKVLEDSSFYNCSSLSSFTLNENVTSIGTSAFYGCASLVKLVNMDKIKITTIPSDMLYGSSSLKEIILPTTVTSIGGSAFRGCAGLTEIVLPTGVTSIGSSAFFGCIGLREMTLPFVGYSATSGQYLGYIFGAGSYYNNATSVPASLKTVTVTGGETLGSGAFYGCNNITEINLPAGLLTVSGYAFYNCTGLTEILIPNTVTSIGDSAFSGCTGLTEILLPTAVTSIGVSAFYGCASLVKLVNMDKIKITTIPSDMLYGSSSLKEIILPTTVTSIGGSAFRGCAGLTEIVLPTGVTSIGSSAFSGCIGLTEMTLPFVGGTATTSQYLGYLFGATHYSNNATYVPASLKIVTVTGGQALGEKAFYQCSNITEVNLSSGILTIGASVFYGCTGLTEISVPNTLTSIGDYIFNGCTSLSKIVNLENTNITIIPNYMFNNCSSLKEVMLPNTLTSIGSNAFYNCTSLTEISVPNTVTSIGGSAFYGCTGLTEILIPNTVTNIGGSAFQNCSSLTEMTLPFVGGTATTSQYLGCIFGTSFYTYDATYVPASLKIVTVTGGQALGEKAFYQCSNITEINLPFGLLTIGNSAFSGCTGLTEILIPNTVTSIGSSAFSGCTGLTEILIPNTVTNIGSSAFSGCTGLTEMVLPFVGGTAISEQYLGRIFGATYYSNNATYVPASLKTVTVTGGQTLGAGAFYGCSNITEINLPTTVTSIDSAAFYGCTGLTEISVPNTVTSIGGSAFYGCTGLTEIFLPTGVSSIGGSVFRGCTNLLHVFNLENTSITSIGNSAFYGCTGLTEISVPNTVTSIGYYAFQNCSNLTKMTLPFVGGTATTSQYLGYLFGAGSYSDNPTYVPASLKTVTVTGGQTLGAGAFYGCSNITEINLPSGLLTIGASVFYGCTGLTEISVPNTVTSIGNSAFRGCTSLSKIVNLENTNITSIGTYAFYGCTGLTEIFLPTGVTSIGTYAFYGCTGLTEIVNLENTNITSIGSAAFYGCTGLTEVVLPTTVTSIDSAAFYGCTGLTEISVPNTVTSIGSSAFSGCTGLTEIILPNSLTSIGDYIFNGCTNLTEIVNLENTSITSISINAFQNCSSLTEISVPNTVTSINYTAFTGCSSLTKMTLPFVGETATTNQYLGRIFGGNSNAAYVPASLKTVTITGGQTLGAGAFYGCSNITEINLPTTVTSIGSNAFYGCTGLTEIVLPTGVTSIGESAFRNCTGLTEILVPTAVTNIGIATFQGCINLTDMTLPFVGISKNATGHTAVFGAIFGYAGSNVAGTVEQKYSGGTSYYYIPSSLRKIQITDAATLPYGAFYNCTFLTEVTINTGVTAISDYAFYNCTGLTEIVLPNTLTSIGSRAFHGCTGLTEISVPNTVTSIGGYIFNGCTSLLHVFNLENTSITSIGSSAFQKCSSLTEISVPSSLTSIGDNIFNGCINLLKINNLENTSITSIGNSAFYGCTGLTEILIPNTVTSISSGAFEECSSLTEMTLPFVGTSRNITGINAVFGAIFGQGSSGEAGTVAQQYSSGSSRYYYIPSSLRKIQITDAATLPYGAFYGCTFLTEVTINPGVTAISDYAFYGCTGLTEIILPNTVTSIGNFIFNGCTSLSKIVNLENTNITSIGTYAFSGCTGLTEISVPNSLTSIGGYIFNGCTSLSKIVNLENTNITSIGTYAFYGCTGLTEIILPTTLTSIGGYAFYGCTGLTEISVPNTVTSIGNSAFRGCTNLLQITNLKNTSITSIGYDAFSSCIGLTEISVPNSLTSIGNNIFNGCINLSKIVNLENTSITSIGDSAFYGCTGLTEISVPNTVTSIGYYAFQNCSSLTEMTLPFVGETATTNRYLGRIFGATYYSNNATYVPASLKTVTVTGGQALGAGAFYGCSNITEINLPTTVTSIGSNAFYGCTGLTEIVLPTGVTSIGEYAFRECTNLTEIVLPNSLTSIGRYAFQNCSSLTEMTLPFVGISKNATGQTAVFGAIFGYAGSNVDGTVTQKYSNGTSYYYIPSSLRKIQITDATTLPYGAFYNCTFLTEVTINTGVTAISDYAFYNCTGLTEIVLPNTLTSIGSSAFHGCTGLTEIVLPTGITSIGSSVFRGCTNLLQITNLEKTSITSIGTYAFYGCTGLTEISVPNTVTSIGNGAFRECTNLTEIVNLENTNITSIGTDAFSGCTGLTEILIPNTVTSISSGAFKECSSLTEMTLPFVGGTATTNQFLGYIFGANSHTSNSIYVPASLKTVTVTGGQTLGADAFYGCSNITEINLPNTLTSIAGGGNGAFRGCSSLTGMTLPFVGGTATTYQFLGYIFGASSYSNNASNVPASLVKIYVPFGYVLPANALYGLNIEVVYGEE